MLYVPKHHDERNSIVLVHIPLMAEKKERYCEKHGHWTPSYIMQTKGTNFRIKTLQVVLSLSLSCFSFFFSRTSLQSYFVRYLCRVLGRTPTLAMSAAYGARICCMGF